MKQNFNPNSKEKSCGSSCGCNDKTEKLSSPKLEEKKLDQNQEENKLDPTHFGDWQVNGRAIDF